MKIPYSRPSIVGNELEYVREAMEAHQFASQGPFTARCQDWIVKRIGAPSVMLMNSATMALEIATILAELSAGDEVIMPAFTFVSCANAVALRGGQPVFVDIRPDTLNIDPAAVAAALTPRSKAVLVVHYAGIICDMAPILKIAADHNLIVIEDAAHAFLSTLNGRHAGTFGHLGIFSFDHQKNVSMGEGGALVINDPRFVSSAEIVQRRGTNWQALLRGEVARYEWVNLGSNCSPSDITAAVLLAQLERAQEIIEARRANWARYHSAFALLEQAGRVQRPTIPAGVEHNAHIYYLLLPTNGERDRLIAGMKARGVTTPFHFVPLDTSPAGRRFGRAHGSLPVSHSIADRLVRLPLWHGMMDEPERVIEAMLAELR